MISLFGAFVFQSTLPARGATRRPESRTPGKADFNPRSPHGERPVLSGRVPVLIYFNPRSPHGERLAVVRRGACRRLISIHAPRTGSDPGRESISSQPAISIHAPRTGSDAMTAALHGCETISIHAPRTGSDIHLRGRDQALKISIHAPRTGSDWTYRHAPCIRQPFQSTLPARGATAAKEALVRAATISIHAPRTGSDWRRATKSTRPRYFNPRSPHGERHSTAG